METDNTDLKRSKPTSKPWPAPAKLNRFLHILGRRADGYHRLQTAFQFLDVADQLWFTPRADQQLHRVDDLHEVGVASEDDLTLRAAKLLASVAGKACSGFDIRLQKNLPIGGGLGGGSSDAATALVALNHYWQLGYSPQRLAELGLQLGADVPVFVMGRAAWAEGVGEQLTPLALDQPWFVVLIPAVAVATATVFADPQLTRDTRPATMRADLSDMRNDCEAVVYRRYPAVAEAATRLSEYAPARLTGTGCCVFAAFAERPDAEVALAACQSAGSRGFIGRGTNRSLLQDRLQQATMSAQ